MSNASDKDLEFADPKEEAAYWKRLAQEYEQKYVLNQFTASLLFVIPFYNRMS
jgi:hypothetical protein